MAASSKLHPLNQPFQRQPCDSNGENNESIHSVCSLIQLSYIACVTTWT